MPPRARFLLTAFMLIGLTLPAPISAQATDCSGYDSQIWAQSDFESDPAHYAALDPDGNGLACEELSAGAAPARWTDEIPAEAEPAQLARVVDGDTIWVNLEGVEEPVRLILIDSPETSDPNNPPECYGQVATAYLGWLLSLGGTLYLEADASDRDRFDRLLRYAWLDFGDGEVYLVNEVMARSGFAAESTFPPDVKYEEEIREASRFAREQAYGLWSGCVTDELGDTDELTGTQGVASVPPVESGPEQTAPVDLVPEQQVPVEWVPEQPAPVESEPAQTAPVEWVPDPTAPVESIPGLIIVADPIEAFDCDPSYPDMCMSPGSADLD